MAFWRCHDCGNEFPGREMVRVQRSAGSANTTHFGGNYPTVSNTSFSQEVVVCERCDKIAQRESMKVLWGVMLGVGIAVIAFAYIGFVAVFRR